MNTTPAHHIRWQRLVFLVCLLSGLVALKPTPSQAQTCTPTPTITPCPSCTPYNNNCGGTSFNEDVDTEPHPAPTPQALAQSFQPPDGTILQQRRYVPDGQGPFYTIVIIHGGGFYSGSPYEGGVQKVAEDLRTLGGYLVLSVTYRLAPCELIKLQPDHSHPESGRPPEQTDDIKSQIRVARADPLCNGHVAVLGGSAGASHALFVALDKTVSPPNTYPNWSQNGKDDRPECVIGLSGPYDFSDRAGTDLLTHLRIGFIHDVENYTNTSVRVDPLGGYDQKSVSPVAKVKPESAQSFEPAFLVASDDEPISPSQIEDMRCTWVSKSINPALYQVLVIS